LRIYKKNFDNAKSLLNIYQLQDLNINFKIKFVIIINDENGYEDDEISYKDDEINEIDSKTNLDYKNESKDYFTSHSLDE